MTALAYLDTSALMRWAEGSVQAPRPQDAQGRQVVYDLIAATGARVAVCEHAILEFLDALVLDWRREASDYDQFDQAWVEQATASFMGLLASGSIEVVNTPSKTGEHAVVLAKIAKRDHGIKFRVKDAIHLITAVAWASREEAIVTLYTSDSDFDRFLRYYTYFRDFLQVRDVCV